MKLNQAFESLALEFSRDFKLAMLEDTSSDVELTESDINRIVRTAESCLLNTLYDKWLGSLEEKK